MKESSSGYYPVIVVGGKVFWSFVLGLQTLEPLNLPWRDEDYEDAGMR